MSGPLPTGWQEAYDYNTRRLYYINTKTAETTWSDPRSQPQHNQASYPPINYVEQQQQQQQQQNQLLNHQYPNQHYPQNQPFYLIIPGQNPAQQPYHNSLGGSLKPRRQGTYPPPQYQNPYQNSQVYQPLQQSSYTSSAAPQQYQQRPNQPIN
ncbi:hypothetical protein G9A89_002220 [Geosiphon pyriformis]|nr:hypothetical protein G9A89_002220 [Geosiphon pyriformis]